MKTTLYTLTIAVTGVLFATPLFATKPGETVNPPKPAPETVEGEETTNNANQAQKPTYPNLGTQLNQQIQLLTLGEDRAQSEAVILYLQETKPKFVDLHQDLSQREQASKEDAETSNTPKSAPADSDSEPATAPYSKEEKREAAENELTNIPEPPDNELDEGYGHLRSAAEQERQFAAQEKEFKANMTGLSTLPPGQFEPAFVEALSQGSAALMVSCQQQLEVTEDPKRKAMLQSVIDLAQVDLERLKKLANATKVPAKQEKGDQSGADPD